MKKNSKFSLVQSLAVLAAFAMLFTAFAPAQQSVVGSVTFSTTGSQDWMQVNSSISLGGHTMSCAQNPVWRASDIKNGKYQSITNTSMFGPCAIDGVLVRDLVLMESSTGVLLTIDMNDGSRWSLMLMNSAGVTLKALTGVGYKGPYAANSMVGFNLIGTLQ